MGPKDALLELMANARSELTATTDQLRGRMGEVADSDGMRVRDLLVHYGGWQRVAARRIGTRMRGGTIQPIESDDYNPHLLALGRQWSDDEAVWEFEDAYAALVEAVRSAPDEECEPDGWAYRYAERTAGSHYADHLPDLERLAWS